MIAIACVSCGNTLNEGVHSRPGMEVQPAVLCKDRQYLIYIPGTTADTTY
jgi:hypothetical protein